MQFVKGGQGTLPYLAPEVLACKGGYTVHRAQDMWALGVALYILLVGDFPWMVAKQEDGEFARHLAGDRTAYPWSAFSPALLQLFDGLLAVDPSARCSAKQARDSLLAITAFFLPGLRRASPDTGDFLALPGRSLDQAGRTDSESSAPSEAPSPLPERRPIIASVPAAR